MSFDDHFDELSREFDFLNHKLMRRLLPDLDEVFEGAKNGKTRGKWQIKQIDEPGISGYIIQGRFGSDRALEPFEPLKPRRRPPIPERPFEIPEMSLSESRQPLTDIFEDEDTLKIYVELPGEEKDDIKLNFTRGNVEIKARNFQKTVELTNKYIDTEKASTEYKNGVLKVTIPKKSI